MPHNKSHEQRAEMFMQPLADKVRQKMDLHTLNELVIYAQLSHADLDFLKNDHHAYNSYIQARLNMTDLPPVFAPMVDFDTEPLALSVYIYEGLPPNASPYAAWRWTGLIFDTLARFSQMNIEPRIYVVNSVVSASQPTIFQLTTCVKDIGEELNRNLLANLLLTNKVPYQLAKTHFGRFGDGWNEDFFADFKLNQSDLSVQIPSLYYQKNYLRTLPADWHQYDLDQFFSDLGLDFIYEL